MPATSKAQFRMMQAAKHNPKMRRRMGISKKVAEEFTPHGASPRGLPERARKKGDHKATADKGWY